MPRHHECVSRQLPSGTVTLLFTDVEGSTKLLHDLGVEAYAEALARHRHVVRTAFAAHGGVEVDTQGDAFFVAFSSAAAGVAAARAAQEALAAGPIRVRMGLHTGTAHLTGEGYVGEDVHLGARIAAVGHGGQVLLSAPTCAHVDGEVTDLGEHRLKDFAEAVRIFQLGSERFPPLKTISNTNLPRPASSFVGRETEVAEVAALLEDGARLVTLTGPGGSGKTRLAIEAAAELVPEFKAGVFWVGLATLRDPALVVDTIAQTLGAKDGLAEHVGERELLLLLDNLEQVVDAAPELAALVEACPNLRFLVTSRELLRVRGEVEYPVPPLAERDAVELFCTRTSLAPDATIAELCRRLDNLPLAVELAAARTSVLSPAQIVDRLAQRLDLLKGGRDADRRQQTLRATVEWSHDLLDEPDKRLFARLAVFAGGCTLDAAEQVVAADLDSLESLVDKSLLRHGDERFWMLETIREFASERLRHSAEAQSLRHRHAEHFLALAAEAEPHILEQGTGADWHGSGPWLDRLEAELDNLRAALGWFHACGEAQHELELAGALTDFWCAKDHMQEGRRRLETALAADERSTASRAKALAGAAVISRYTGDPATTQARAEEARTLYEELGYAWRVAHATFWLASGIADLREFARAKDLFAESGRSFRELGDAYWTLFATRMVAWMLYELGDQKGARELHEANLERIRGAGYRGLEATTVGALASYAAEDGRVEDALALSAETLRLYLELGDRNGVAHQLCRCAGALATAGRAETATQLLACSEALHEELGTTMLPHLIVENEKTLAKIRAALDDAALAEARDQGRKLSADEAVATALGSLAGATAGSRSRGV
jgi:predicted ATPase/class 3 adenylate cyclase